MISVGCRFQKDMTATVKTILWLTSSFNFDSFLPTGEGLIQWLLLQFRDP
jgi:hypothetical protein